LLDSGKENGKTQLIWIMAKGDLGCFIEVAHKYGFYFTVFYGK